MIQGGKDTVFFVSLGCAKNLVDSEHMMGRLASAGFSISGDITGASIAVINTCAFIEPAVEESIDTILEVARRKESCGLRRLIVAGCLVQRYGKKLMREMREVDCWLGTSCFGSIVEAVNGPDSSNEEKLFIRPATNRDFCYAPRLRATPFYTSYLKIAEGCSHSCAYCTIPSIRGPLRSREITDLVLEAQTMRDSGVKEINLIAQDTTDYGKDLKGRPRLEDLLEELLRIDGLSWIRVLYSNPAGITERLLRLIESEDRLCPYLDIPIQHINSELLASMGRPYGRDDVEGLLQQIRSLKRRVALRTTLMVGYPGENKKMYLELKEFVEASRFDHLGAFSYSPERGTAAERLPMKVSKVAARKRLEGIMSLQKRISFEINQGLVGKRIKVLLEGPSDETDLLLRGRAAFMAPDVDAQVLINKGSGRVGEIVDVLITEAHPYQVVGEIAGT